MPSVVRSAPASPKSHIPTSKNKFRTVLGLGTVFRDLDPRTPLPAGHNHHNNLTRKSVDTPRSYRQSRKHRSERSSVSDSSFFQISPADTIPSNQNPDPLIAKRNMNPIYSRPRRPPVRIDAQDGLWSVSVAESPYSVRSFSLYIKSK